MPAVLSIALPRRLHSARVKEVVHTAPQAWMHHLELRGVGDLDDELAGWIAEAFDAAA